MYTKREQPIFEPIESMNLKFRLRELKYLEKNNLHMYENLKKTGPSVATKEELSHHWERHLEQSYLMRKKHFGVLPASPLKKPKSLEIKEKAAALSISRQNSEGSISRQNSRSSMRSSMSRQNSTGSILSRSSSLSNTRDDADDTLDQAGLDFAANTRSPKIKFEVDSRCEEDDDVYDRGLGEK